MDREFLSNYRFHQVTLASTINKMKAKTFHASKKPSRDEEEILNAAKNNVAQRVVMLLGMDTQLVKTLDNKGNSLLHITAKNRNLQLFESVLKRTGL